MLKDVDDTQSQPCDADIIVGIVSFLDTALLTRILLIFNIGITGSYLGTDIPVLGQRIFVAYSYAATEEPALITVWFQPLQKTEQQFLIAEIKLTTVDIRSPKESVHHLTGPKAILSLHRPMFMDTIVSSFPRSYTAIHLKCTAFLNGDFYTRRQRSCHIKQQIVVDGYMLGPNRQASSH